MQSHINGTEELGQNATNFCHNLIQYIGDVLGGEHWVRPPPAAPPEGEPQIADTNGQQVRMAYQHLSQCPSRSA
jgi:hypothetical protein